MLIDPEIGFSEAYRKFVRDLVRFTAGRPSNIPWMPDSMMSPDDRDGVSMQLEHFVIQVAMRHPEFPMALSTEVKYKREASMFPFVRSLQDFRHVTAYQCMVDGFVAVGWGRTTARYIVGRICSRYFSHEFRAWCRSRDSTDALEVEGAVRLVPFTFNADVMISQEAAVQDSVDENTPVIQTVVEECVESNQDKGDMLFNDDSVTECGKQMRRLYQLGDFIVPTSAPSKYKFFYTPNVAPVWLSKENLQTFIFDYLRDNHIRCYFVDIALFLEEWTTKKFLKGACLTLEGDQCGAFIARNNCQGIPLYSSMGNARVARLCHLRLCERDVTCLYKGLAIYGEVGSNFSLIEVLRVITKVNKVYTHIGYSNLANPYQSLIKRFNELK